MENYSVTFLGVFSLLTFLVTHRIYKIYYDLFLHPLAHIPGPKLAAITLLYQTYYSLVGGSRFYIQIGKLHEKYGPVVRITPNEVHLNDPDNYDKIYYVGSPYFKAKTYYEAMSGGASAFSTISNEEYRPKRARLSPFFSRKRVLELEDVVQHNTQKLLSLMSTKFAQGEKMDLHHGYRAVSADIITDYAFDRCYNLLDRQDVGENYFKMWEDLGPTMWIFQQWPFLMTIANIMPEKIAAAISPPLANVFQVQEHCRTAMSHVQASMSSPTKTTSNTNTHRTIFHDLLTPSPADGYVVPPLQELTDESISILGAAADTTGNAMTVATIEVTKDPVIYKRLVSELREEFPNYGKSRERMEFLKLEKLPFLTCVIKEAIRLSFGDPGKLSREVPPPGATFNGYYIPAGSYISMSSWDLHRNETYFPNAMKFDPDRWADRKVVKRMEMEKAYVPFGKGGQNCIGINLAYCELYVVLGHIFRTFDNMVGNELKLEDRIYDDYISSRTPRGATKFCVSAGPKI